jgi:fatty-acyl-CoA synthase
MIESDGAFYFTGRIKEMIKTGGINVTPADVEDELQSHPAVQLAIVVGVPDPEREEIVAAMVVPKEGVALDVDELLRYCRRSAAAFKVPRYLELVSLTRVPLTDTGKVHQKRIQEVLTTNYRAQAKRFA